MQTYAVTKKLAMALTVAGLTAFGGSAVIAEEPDAYVVNVSDVTAKVGEPTVMLATLKVRDGYRSDSLQQPRHPAVFMG